MATVTALKEAAWHRSARRQRQRLRTAIRKAAEEEDLPLWQCHPRSVSNPSQAEFCHQCQAHWGTVWQPKRAKDRSKSRRQKKLKRDKAKNGQGIRTGQRRTSEHDIISDFGEITMGTSAAIKASSKKGGKRGPFLQRKRSLSFQIPSYSGWL